jgi:hypothetical protein
MRDSFKKNEPVDNSKINCFGNSYNHTIYKETGMRPIQMQNDKTFEVEYIINKLPERANTENQPRYKLNVDDKVRLIENKHIIKKVDIM